MNSDIKQYASRLADTDTTNFLGRLCWFSIPGDLRVPHGDFEEALKGVGVTAVAPNAPQAPDVFRRICSNIKRSKIPTKDPEILENYRVVEFKTESDVIVRRVVRERVDSGGKRVGYDQIFDAIFDRETEDVTIRSIGGFKFKPGGVPEELRDSIIDGYYMDRNALHDQPVREWIRRTILNSRSTAVKRGVYFLQESHADLIGSLEDLGSELQDYTERGEVEVHSLPLIDDRKQRAMIQRAYEAETVDAVDAMMGEIAAIRKDNKKITSERYVALVGQYQELTDKTKEYEDLLEEKLASTTHRLDLFSRSLLALRSNIKEAA